MKKWLKLFGLAYVFIVFLWVFNVTEGVGANTRSGYVELPNTTGAVPNLYVNGNLQTPLASSQQDVLISFCSSKQEWKLLQEYSNWDNVNRFGYYTDLGVGHNTVLVFRGPDAAGAKDTTYITAGARIGLWLLNDQNDNGIYDGNDSYLFSERMLTRGSTVGEHQWFMVYDVSAFKGTGATYFFDTFTEDFTTSGDFDYLIYIDDDHTDANMDHNDMIVGAISLGNPPVITAPDSTKMLCNPDTIRFTVTATDIDAGDSLTLQKISGPGTFNTVTGTSPLSGQLKYYVSASGTYNFIFKATDKCGKVDYDTTTYVITMNTPPTVVAPDSSKYFCNPDTIRFTVTATDPNSGDTLTLSGPGISTPIKGLSPLSANIKIYVSSAGTYNYIYTVNDKCGASDADTATWTISINSPPVVTAPDNNKFICSPGDSVNFTVNATDPNTGQNLTLEKTSGPGSFATVNGVSPLSGTQKWAPATAGTYNFIYKVTDACGAVDYDTATWVISFNTPPVVSAPDSSKFLCNPDTIRFNVSGTDTDPNDTLKLELVSSPGIFTTVNGPSPVSGALKYYVTATGTYNFIFKVTDKCGAVDYDTASWFVIKDATTPVVTAPDSSKTLCGPDTIRFTVTATDANPYDTLKLYKYSGPGTFYPDTVKGNPPLSGTLKYYVTASGTYNFIFKTMDKCGRYDFDTATYVINMNTPPTVTAPDSSKSFCGPDTIRFTVTATDPNSGDTLTLSGPGIPTPIKGLSPLSANVKIYVSSAGTYNYIYTVSDKCGASDADTATWTITVNSPPVVTAPDSSKSFCGPDTIRYTVTATDPNSGDTLTLSGPGIPTPIKGLSPLSANIKIYVSSAGTYNYIYTVSDKCGASDADTATWTITVNSPPVVTAPDSSKSFCGPDTIRFTVTATDPNSGDTLTLSGPGIPTPIKGLSPLSANVKIYVSSAGTYNYIYTVSDKCGASDADTATWTITVNSPPVVTAPDSSKSFCGPDTIRFTVTATDPNSADTLTLSGPGIPTPIKGLSPLSANVKIYVSSAGTYNYIYIVNDKCGASDADTASWTITMNSPPVVTAPDSTKSFCGPDTIRFTVTATDPNSGDTLTLSGPGIPSPIKGLSPLSANVKIYVSSAGSYNYIYTVSDKCGSSDADTATWTITINHPPNFTAPPDSSKIFCGPDTIRFTICATDDDPGDTLTLSGSGIPISVKGVSPLCTTVKFYISSSGTYQFIWTVKDKCNASVTDTSTWTVTMNNPPIVIAPDSSKFFCGPDTIRFRVIATDPDVGDTITLSGPGIPTPIKGISPVYADVKFYISSGGTYNYVYQVTNHCGSADYDTATWTITMNSPPTVTAPDSSKFFCGPDTIRFTVTATDPNSGDTLTLSGPGISSPIKGLSPLSANIKIYVSSAGTYGYIYTVTDKCGASDADTATWTITMNHPPSVTAPDSSKFFCGPDTIRFRVTATDPDAGDTITLSGPGIPVSIKGISPVYADVKFYISSGGTYNYVYQVTNHCGSVDYDTATWVVTINRPPIVIAPDTSKFLCGPDTIRFRVCATDDDPGDTITLSGSGIPTPIKGVSPVCANVKFYINSAGTNNCFYTVTDKCGASDADTASWTITMNSPPVVTAPDSTKSFCGPDTIRFTVTATDPNSGDTLTLSGPGIPSPIKGLSPLSTNIKIYVSSAGTYNYIYTVSDKCGASDADTATWTITMNHPPTVAAPDSSKFFCGPDTIRFRVTATDPDAGDTITLSGPGISVPIKGVSPVYANVKFYISSSGTYNYVYQVTNHCGSAVYDTATWTVTVNSPPTLNLPQSITACLGDTARLTVTGDDPDKDYNITLEKTSGVGNFNTIIGKPPLNGSWWWVPADSDTTSKVVFKVTDHCGRSVTDTVTVTVQSCACDIFVKIGEDSCANPGDTVSIPILLKTSVQIGGFDLRIEFDPTVLSFMNVTRGSGLPSGWEYFTYRQLPCPLCGCCKYKLLLLGIYDLKNTQAGVPIEPSSDYIEVARVKFQVSSNNNLRGFFSNICFEWDKGNCTQNSFSDVSGYKLYVSSNPDQFSYADCDTQFDVGNEVLNRVCFEDCGGVLICTTGEKVIGDINLNLIPYDPADLTLFSNYFIYGLSVFMSDPNLRSVQIANTDVNRDGFTLTLSDFIYMIRVILHDASPLPKLTPEESQLKVLVTTRNSDHIITFDSKVPVGAALLVFKHKSEIASSELSSSQMEMRAGDVSGEFRVLIYSSAGNSISSGINEVLKVKTKEGLELASIEAVDPYGRPLSVTKASSALPKEFTLYPNYPNPFNPETNISFALPENSRVCLKIYNLSGQLVKTLVDANLTAGTYTVSWNGTNGSEEKVASGIYFYKLSAGSYSQTRKMCLIK